MSCEKRGCRQDSRVFCMLHENWKGMEGSDRRIDLLLRMKDRKGETVLT